MAVEKIFRVTTRRGEEKDFMGKDADKEADLYDKRLESMYDLSDKLADSGVELAEGDRDKLAEFMVDNRDEIEVLFKAIPKPRKKRQSKKDAPADNVADLNVQQDTHFDDMEEAS